MLHGTGPLLLRTIILKDSDAAKQFTRSDDARIRKNWASFKKEHFED
jgi:hypothetical protein